MDSVKFQTRVTKKDYIAVFLFLFIRDKKYWFSILFYLGALFLLLQFFTSTNYFYTFIIILLWLLIVVSYKAIGFFKGFSKEPGGYMTIDWEINEDCIKATKDDSTTDVRINKILKILETKKYFYIYTGVRETFQISKAGISNTNLKSIRFFLGKKIAKWVFNFLK